MPHSPSDYSIPLSEGMTLEKCKQIAEKDLQIFTIPINSSEIWQKTTIIIAGEGLYQTRKIKYEFKAKIEKNEIQMKLTGNFNIKMILNLPEPRDAPITQNDCAIFLRFWDTLIQHLGWLGRMDIGKPRETSQSNKSPKNITDTKTSEKNVPKTLVKALDTRPLSFLTDEFPPAVNPFMLNISGKEPSFYRFKKSITITLEKVLQAFVVNLSIEEFSSQPRRELPKGLKGYHFTGKFGPDEMNLEIIVGERDGYIYVRFIAANLHLEDIYKENIRKIKSIQSQSAFFVKLYDNACKELMIPIREDLGVVPIAKESHSGDAVQQIADEIRLKIEPQLVKKLENNAWILPRLVKFDQDISLNLSRLQFIHDVLEKAFSSPLINVITFELTLQNYVSPSVGIFVDFLNNSTKGIKPVILTYAILTPQPILKEISYSPRGIWITDSTDKISQSMANSMNSGVSSLDHQLKLFYQHKDSYIHCDESVEQTLQSPVMVRNVENDIKTLIGCLTISRFIPRKDYQFAEIGDPHQPLTLLENLFNEMGRFFIESGVTCPFCGVLSMNGEIRCPNCGYNLMLVREKSDKQSLNVDEESYSIDKNTESNLKLGSLDSLIKEMDEDLWETQKKIVDALKQMVNNDEIDHVLIKNMDENTRLIKQNNKDLVLTLPKELEFGSRLMKLIELQLNNPILPKLLMGISFVQVQYLSEKVPFITYLAEMPALVHSIKLQYEIQQKTAGKFRKTRFKWIGSNTELDLLQRLNQPSVMEYIDQIFGGEDQQYTYDFIAKTKDSLGKFLPIEGTAFQLPFLITISPYPGEIPKDRFACILHQFLKSNAEDFGGLISVYKIVGVLNAILSVIQKKKPMPFADYIKQKTNPNYLASLQNDELSKIKGSRMLTEDERERIRNRCFAASIDPNMSIPVIDVKLQEIAHQRKSFDELHDQFSQAYVANQVSIEEYQQKLDELEKFTKGLDMKEDLLQSLRRTKT